MPRAVLQNGEIRPVEPLPCEWREGEALRVEKAEDDDATAAEIDRDFARLEALCADSDPVEEERLAEALQQAREQSKAQVRRQMGLS
jgi:hypothetical protein